ncbi:OmpA family protein [Holophaga foetida]|uniref:OmpA family protein n=1 Tax=Holophaga foetida TaxID=35839 RepID=UPI000301B4E6|nr:OmpA family protein [Holophaga foetida]
MPDADGGVGVVEVRNAQGRQALDRPRQSVQVVGADQAPGKPEILSDARIQADFGAAIAAQPKAPLHFILQFETGSTTLTAASRPLIGKILEAIQERSPLDVGVVGHTDTSGSDERNNLLARQRAETVAQLLVDAGADPAVLEIKSHGKAVLLVPTGDQVPEPRNRRVEVTVR